MLSSIFNQQLTVPLAPSSVLKFLNQSNFWQQVWRASTITESTPFQIELRSHLKLTLFSTPIQITQSLPHPSHPCQAIASWSDHRLILNYHLSSPSSASSLLRFSAHLDESNLIAQSQAKLILRHHWHNFVSTLHESQHEFLFQNLQSSPGSLSQSVDSESPITNQQDANIQINATNHQLINSQPPSTNLNLPAINNQQAPTTTQPVTASNQSPATNSQPPQASLQSPITSHHKPTTNIPSSPLFTQLNLPTLPLPTHGFTLWRRVTDWQKTVKPIFAKEHLTASQWLVLYFLVELSHQYPSLTASQLAKLTNLHKMLISDLAKQLVKKHYLRKLKLSHNKKEYQLQVTASGKTAAFAVFGKLQQAEKEFFKNFRPPPPSLSVNDPIHPHPNTEQNLS